MWSLVDRLRNGCGVPATRRTYPASPVFWTTAVTKRLPMSEIRDRTESDPPPPPRLSLCGFCNHLVLDLRMHRPCAAEQACEMVSEGGSSTKAKSSAR